MANNCSSIVEDEHPSTATIIDVPDPNRTISGNGGISNTANNATTPVETANFAVNLPAVVQDHQTSTAKTRAALGRTESFKSIGTNSSRRSIRNVGIVIGDFKGLYSDELNLTVGERIEIISKDTIVSRNIGWWTGRNSHGTIGIFPSNLVKVVTQSEALLDNSDIDYPLEIPSEDIQLYDVIGLGGFGKVYRAKYRGEEVAVKVARHTTFDTVKIISDVLTEAEKFARLAHENICALIGVCLVKDVCLVMEYAKGGPLSKVLHERNTTLTVDIILDWSKQITEGMEYLHHEVSPSLIHRDLKSSNSEFLQMLSSSFSNFLSS